MADVIKGILLNGALKNGNAFFSQRILGTWILHRMWYKPATPIGQSQYFAQPHKTVKNETEESLACTYSINHLLNTIRT